MGGCGSFLVLGANGLSAQLAALPRAAMMIAAARGAIASEATIARLPPKIPGGAAV